MTPLELVRHNLAVDMTPLELAHHNLVVAFAFKPRTADERKRRDHNVAQIRAWIEERK